MLREQQLMERIINEIGEEFNEYINCFYVCDLWKIKEGELIVNKTFKKVVDIIADFNLTTGNKILENRYKLIESNEAMLKIMDFMTHDYIHNGSQSLLNRAMVFCYSVFIMTQSKKKSALEVLESIVNSEVLFIKKSIINSILYTFKLRPRPYLIEGDLDAIMLISLLKGNPAQEVLYSLAEYKEFV